MAIAASEGRLDCLKFLVGKGGDVNKTASVRRSLAEGLSLTPTPLTARYPHTPLCARPTPTDACSAHPRRSKLKHHAHPTHCSPHDRRPPSPLAPRPSPPIACSDQDGSTAVMYAVLDGHLDCLTFLVASGADINASTDVSALAHAY